MRDLDSGRPARVYARGENDPKCGCSRLSAISRGAAAERLPFALAAAAVRSRNCAPRLTGAAPGTSVLSRSFGTLVDGQPPARRPSSG